MNALDRLPAIFTDYARDPEIAHRPNPDVLVRFALALDVSSDEILGIAKPQKSAPALSDLGRRFLRRLQQLDKLPKRDQDAILRTIDAFLAKTDAA